MFAPEMPVCLISASAMVAAWVECALTVLRYNMFTLRVSSHTCHAVGEGAGIPHGAAKHTQYTMPSAKWVVTGLFDTMLEVLLPRQLVPDMC